MQPATGKQPAVLQKFRKLRVDNVPATVDTVQLRQLFGKHGEVEKVHLIRGRKKSCGIVKYRFATSAVEATKHLNGYLLMNACLEVAHTVQPPVQKAKNIHPAVKSHSQPPLPQGGQSGSQQKVRKLQVDAIPTTMDEAELRQLFEKHGDVVKVHLIRGRKKSRGIVKYKVASSAEDAIRWYSRQGMLLKVAYTAKTKAPKVKAPIPVPLKARQDEGKVAELQHELLSAKRQHTLAVEALQRHQAEIKRLKAADHMTQRLLRKLTTLRLPTFSTSKPADNDERMEEWIKSKEPSEAFQSQVKEIRGEFRAAFPNGCAFYGSSSDGTDTAMNDSDVDLAVLFPSGQLEAHLKKKIPLLTLTSDSIVNPKCQTALMYHWKYKDLGGEVVVFPNESDFNQTVKDRRQDSLSNLEDWETKGVKFMKRLRIAAFGGLGDPKSRVLTHVVHEVHSQESRAAAPTGYSYTHYIPLYLDAFLNLSAANFKDYIRYKEAEWRLLKNVIRCVKQSFGLVNPADALAEDDSSDDERFSWR